MSASNPPAAGIELTFEQRVAWLRLTRSENVGPATFIDLIKRFGTAAQALEALPELAGRSGRGAIRIPSVDAALSELDQIQSMDGRTVCLGEPGYPAALRAADAPPPVLTVLGNADLIAQNCVAIVGSRNASLSGIRFTKDLARDLGQEGYVVVSGLARGIDAAAHKAALKHGTVAVFAGGVDHVYPHENKRLAHEILQNRGAFVSEMPLGWKPRAQDFPRRNRIVAGMAMGLVVVEAARRSGSLISARLANEAGRLVFAVPGSPLDPRSEGANLLIQQGASLITHAQDVVRALDPMVRSPVQQHYTLDETNRRTINHAPDDSERALLVNALSHAPIPVDELIRHTGLNQSIVQMVILELDLAGRIERHSGNCVSLV